MAHLAHLYQPGVTYLLTSVTYRRRPFFAQPDCAQAAYEDVAFYAQKFRAASLAYVVMPDHLHWVICPSAEDFERFAHNEREKHGKYAAAPERFYLSKILEDYRRHTGFVVNRLQGTGGAQMWQAGFRDDGLRTPTAIRAPVRYVVLNPVKAGLVTRPKDYPYVAWDAAWLV
ncbi:MAG: hypothetical protein AB1801_09860 [Chloroflexota bacterium]